MFSKLIILLFSIPQFAQIVVPMNGVDPGGDPGYPIVEYILFLLTGGVIYGAKSIRRKNKNKLK